jgi:hypothetical protein
MQNSEWIDKIQKCLSLQAQSVIIIRYYLKQINFIYLLFIADRKWPQLPHN